MGVYTVSVRVPGSWHSRVDSEFTSRALDAFLRQPGRLPPDPGPGNERLCLSLPEAEVRAAVARVRGTPSSVLRRIVAWKISCDGLPRTAQGNWWCWLLGVGIFAGIAGIPPLLRRIRK